MIRLAPGAIALCLVTSAVAAQDPRPSGGFDRHLFPPELVMQHQRAIGLQAEQRSAITTAIKQLQSQVLDLQWQMEEENHKLATLLQGSSIDRTQALEQIDRVLNLERQVKRAHLTMLVEIKNTLTREQQERLASLREETPPRRRP